MITKLSEPDVSEDQGAGLRASERVAAILADRIRTGAYSAGDLLPTERTLAAELRVHRRSVRSAVDHLVGEGLVYRRPNCRPTVRELDSSTIDRLPADQAPVRQRIPPPVRDGRQTAARKTRSPRISTSNLIALLMWHGRRTA